MIYVRSTCESTWWWNLLYINNFADKIDSSHGSGCIGWTWYLADDMQFFIISPLIIYPLWKLDKFGKLGKVGMLVMAVICLTVSTVIPAYLTVKDNEIFNGDLLGFYVKPWNRFQPYLIGLFLGGVLHKLRSQPKLHLPKPVVLCLWCAATVAGASVVYGIARYNPVSSLHPSLADRAAYNGLSKLAWSLALSWLILACVKVRNRQF